MKKEKSEFENEKFWNEFGKIWGYFGKILSTVHYSKNVAGEPMKSEATLFYNANKSGTRVPWNPGRPS